MGSEKHDISLFLILALIFSFGGGALLRSFSPHTHPHESESVWQLSHDALRHEEKYILLVSQIFLTENISLSFSFSKIETLSFHTLPSLESLRAGILKYRHFS